MLAIHQLRASFQLANNNDYSPYTPYTLNSKYAILQDKLPTNIPKLRYFGIGINGFKNTDNLNNGAPYIPSTKNLDLYTPIPFRCVPVTNDIKGEERDKYRMRVLKNIYGVDYYCYYLKLLTITNADVDVTNTNINTGEETFGLPGDFSDNLNPTPENTVLQGVSSDTIETNVSVTCIAPITGEEVNEVMSIMYPDNPLLKARISELGLYFGEDLEQIDEDNDAYNESIYTILGYHRTSLGTDYSDPSTVGDIRFKLSSANSFLS